MFDRVQVSTLDITNIVHIKNALDNYTCKEIVKQVLAFKETHESTPDSDNNCWRGEPHSKGGLTSDVNFKIQETISKAVDFYETTLPIPKTFANAPSIKETYDIENPKIAAWFNVNNLGGANMIHIHGGSYLSGCMYFQATDTGYIEFFSQHYLYKNMHPVWPYFGSAKYYPEDGDLILFPSFLAHEVEPNPNMRQRINMAFNIEYNKL